MPRVEVTIDVADCARCNGDHVALKFKPFTQAVGEVASHWAMCPNIGEPVLMWVGVDKVSVTVGGDQ